MLVERIVVALACGLCLGAVAVAEDEPAPDAEFLAYLGMWEVTDEDWLLLDDVEAPGQEERSDPVPDGEESTEIRDEG